MYIDAEISEKDYPRLAEIWESAVRATHHFLTEEDMDYYRRTIAQTYFPIVKLFGLKDEKGLLRAFAGIVDEKLEMLFVDDSFRGNGCGTMLLREMIDRYGVRYVDVNEQNIEAVRFYRARGFTVVGRDETDSEGKPYPILHLQLSLI